MTGISGIAISKHHRDAARVTLGELSKASIQQLVTLFDACSSAQDIWNGAGMMPRSGYEGDDERVPTILSDEWMRLFYLKEAIVAEVRRRPMPDRYETERARVLVAWYDATGEDDTNLYRDMIKSLTAIVPGVNTTIRH
jgi:hypothetical protein